MGWETRKVFRSLKLHISHQMRPYASVKTTCGSRGVRVTLEKLGVNTPNYVLGYTENNPKSSTPHFKSVQTLLKCYRVELYLFLGIWGTRAIWGKLDHDTPDHGLGYAESNPKSSSPHFTLNEALLKCLRVKLNMF